MNNDSATVRNLFQSSMKKKVIGNTIIEKHIDAIYKIQIKHFKFELALNHIEFKLDTNPY